MPAVQKVILFGSYASGRRDLLTDLDLLVVMHSPLDFVTRSVELARRLRAGAALDLLVYYYIPTRYPNGLPDDIPAPVYNRVAAEGALALAEAVVARVNAWFTVE